MDSSEKDEGYNSPLEAFDSRSIFHKKKRRTTLDKSCSSWDQLSEMNQDVDVNMLDSKFITEIVQNSSVIIDSLWLTLPESQAGRMAGGGDSESEIFQSSSIVEVVRYATKPRYISLKEFLRDTIDLLCGKQSKTFVLQDEKRFRKHPAVLIHGLTPTVISNISARYLETGNSVVKLNQIEEHFHFQTSVLETTSNVCVSFVKLIKDFLKVYQTIVMIRRESIRTLTSLRTFFMPYQQQIEVLVHIMEAQEFASPVLLLKNLNDFMLQSEVPWVSDMLQNLLISCASAYARYVSDWIFRGTLCSPLEFHIMKNRNAIAQNRKFWTQQFTQNDDIPLFIKKFKNYMFDTGRVVNLIKELQSNDLPVLFGNDDDIFIDLKLSHQSIVQLMQDHEAKLSDFFLQYKHLRTEIEIAVTSTTQEHEQIDQAAIQRSTSDYLLKFQSMKLQEFKDEQQLKKTKMDLLLQEMEEARHNRLRHAMDDLFEEKKAERIQQEKYNLESSRGYELLQKYYGEILSDFSPMPINPTHQVPVSKIAGANNVVTCHGDDNISETEESGILVTNYGGEDNLSTSSLTTTEGNFDKHGILDDFECSGVIANSLSGGGDYIGSSNSPEYLRSDDFKVQTTSPFKLNLDMFSKQLIPSSSPKDDSDFSISEECDVFLTNRFLSLSVEIPLMTHHKMVNLALLHHIIVTKQLCRHVKIIQDYLLLQNGLFGQFLCEKLIDRVKKGLLKRKEDIPGQICALNQDMEEVLNFAAVPDDVNFLKYLRFDRMEEVPSPEKPITKQTGVEKKKKQTITSEYEVLNSLCLRYSVDWPLNIFFTDEFFQKYEDVFRLQMQLYRSEILLEKAAKLLKCKTVQSSQLHELHFCRSVMLHFVRSLRSYINVTVIHASWTELASSFIKMDSVEKIYELLVQHIKTVISNCLLGPKAKAVMKLLTSQFTVIESFCSKIQAAAGDTNWSKGEKIAAKEFKILIQQFKVFREIEKVFVQGKVINT